MKSTHMAVPFLCIALLFTCVCGGSEEGIADAPPAKPDTEGRAMGAAEDLREKTEETVKDLGNKVNLELGRVAEKPLKAWCAFGLMVVVGIISLLFGWTIVHSFLVPFAPLWGLALGVATSYSVIQAFYSDWGEYVKLALLGAGALLGMSLFLFTAIRAKPIAAFLIVMSPFLVASAFLLDYSMQTGIALFVIGFVAGFAAMIEIRPLAIGSTSLLGALCFGGAYGLLARLLRGEGTRFLDDSFNWLLANPWMLLIAVGAIMSMGMSFQFASGPRTSPE